MKRTPVKAQSRAQLRQRINAAVLLVDVLQRASDLGMSAQVRGSGVLWIDFELEAPAFRYAHGRRRTLGSIGIDVRGEHSGSVLRREVPRPGPVTNVRGIGIHILRELGWPEADLQAYERLARGAFPENARAQQASAVQLCQQELQRRADYGLAMEAGDLELCRKLSEDPEGT